VNPRMRAAAPHRKQPSMRTEVRRGFQGKALSDSSPGLRLLPVEFRADLTNAGRLRVGDDSEVRGAGDVPARIHKLRVVEDVEEFDTQIKGQILFYLCPLQEPKIGVVESRAVEKPTIGSAECSGNAIQRECTHTRQARCRCHVAGHCWRRKTWRRRDEVASRTVGGWAIRIRFARI
jgi:hypothetical protein